MIFTLDLETEGHVSVYVTFCLVRLLKHVEHDGTFSFKVKHGGHANGDSWNEFPDLKSLRNNQTIGRTNTSRDNKDHVDHDVTFSFKVARECMREGHPIGDS